jgi:drug/metabolite transporter superfamily protein YnfA
MIGVVTFEINCLNLENVAHYPLRCLLQPETTRQSRMKKSFTLTVFLLAASLHEIQAQNVGINSTGAAPDASAMLDVVANNRGALIPRMTTAQRTAIVAPATGLFVYDTSLNAFLYWDGTAWRMMAYSGGWLLTGNAITATDFMGSTNAQPVSFRSNNVERMRIAATTNGEVVLNQPGAFGFFAGDIFSVYTTGANFAVNGYISGSGTGIAVYGENTSSGANSTSGLFIATSAGYSLYADATAANRPGIFGASSAATGTAIIGLGNNLATYYTLTGGVGGAFTSSNAGVYGFGSVAAATGGVFVGNNTTSSLLAGGTGIAATGTNVGVYGHANNTGNNTWGGYFSNGTATDYAYVGGRTGATNYKINGPGAVSTIVRDTNNQLVNLYCPESPEVLFQDFGQGQLVNGRAQITLDPNFTKNISVNEQHPLRVIIQLEGDCQGVYVANKTATGFEVIELQGGTSTVNFTWFVTANRADSKDASGNLVSKFADVRFGAAPGPMEEMKAEAKPAEKPAAPKKELQKPQ